MAIPITVNNTDSLMLVNDPNKPFTVAFASKSGPLPQGSVINWNITQNNGYATFAFTVSNDLLSCLCTPLGVIATVPDTIQVNVTLPDQSVIGITTHVTLTSTPIQNLALTITQ